MFDAAISFVPKDSLCYNSSTFRLAMFLQTWTASVKSYTFDAGREMFVPQLQVLAINRNQQNSENYPLTFKI